MKKRLLALTLSLLMLLALLAGCTDTPAAPSGAADSTAAPDSSGESAAPETTEPAAPSELAVPVPAGVSPSEDNARVFYEIFVGSFSDSDGDGVGDLRGIINRMDYLNDGDESSGRSLGVEGIWLTPIFPSSSYHKYDANDYCAVDPAFGTLEDLKELAELCHQRNVKLILDLPLNHTSRLHPWYSAFVQAHRNGAKDDPYYNYYSFYTKGESAPAGRNFAPLSGTDDYYECNFDSGMPELNYDCEAVRQAAVDTAKFWLELGVDGFRFDAAKYIYYGDHSGSVSFWLWYLEQLKAVKPDIYTVAEVWDGDGVTQLYYPAVNCFDFSVSQAEGLISAVAQKGDANRYTKYVGEYLNTVRALREDAMYVPFIANHDTDRCAGYLPSLNGSAQMAANLLLLSPGSPFLYYGEELGMRGSRGGANTDANRRLAMVWGDGDPVKDPQGASYPADNRADASALEQRSDENSLYNYYKRVILLRKANPEIARGSYSPLQLTDTRAGGFISEWKGSRALVLHNPTGSAVSLDLKALGLAEFATLSGSVGMGEASLEGGVLTLAPQSSAVLR
ncbi:MAG: hypothetical protein IKQ04_08730 [Oscillospiraceae bacterium]|nr:hypothetical protein [Oscillospiraceae bacterium]